MVGWHHQLNGREFEQAPGDGDGQESLVCCSSWGYRVGCNSATELNSHLTARFLRFNQPFSRPCGIIVFTIEKYPYMSETIQFKIMLFKGHLYAPFHRYTHHSKFYSWENISVFLWATYIQNHQKQKNQKYRRFPPVTKTCSFLPL